MGKLFVASALLLVVVLVLAPVFVSAAMVEPNRILAEECSNSDIAMSQGATELLPNHIPTYTVEITNVCATGCSISDIHLKCGMFSSSTLIDPKIFKRLAVDDCLVNDGQALAPGQIISFKYSNTFSYPLSVGSVVCN